MSSLIDICLFNCDSHGNDGVDFSDLEQLEDAWAHSSRNHPDLFALAPNIMADDHANAR